MAEAVDQSSAKGPADDDGRCRGSCGDSDLNGPATSAEYGERDDEYRDDIAGAGESVADQERTKGCRGAG